MPNRIQVPVTHPVLAGITWTEQYECYSAQIAHWLDLSFSLTNEGL
jgi:hypothetical protein